MSVFAQLFTLQIFCVTRPFTAFAPPALQTTLTKSSHHLPAAFSCAQEQHHITFCHSTVSHYLFTIKTVSFFYFIFFPACIISLGLFKGLILQHTENFRFLLASVEHEEVSATCDRPVQCTQALHLQTLNEFKLLHCQDVLFFRHSRCML